MRRVASKGAAKPAAKAKAKPAATKAKPAAAKAKPAATKAKPAATKAKPAAKRASTTTPSSRRQPAPPSKPAPRADYGAPVEVWLAKQAPPIRAISDALRALIAEVVPAATGALKWGNAFYACGDGMDAMLCAITAHKAHVNLVLPGPPGTYDDPAGLLGGDSQSGRHLRLTAVADVPADAVRGWLRVAAARAAAGG